MADNSDKITETSFTMDISETDTDTEIRQPTETATEITREHPDYVNIVPQPLAEITREHPDYVNIVPQCSAEITEHPDYVNIVPQPSAETDESSDEISADESYALYPDLSPEVTEPTDFMVDETFLELPVHPVYANEIIKNRLGKKSTKSPRDVKPKTPVHPVYANVIIKERGDDMTAEPIPSTSTAEITVEQTPEKDKSVAKKRKIKQKDSPPRVNIISTIPPSLAAKIDRTNVTEYPLYMNIITKYPEVHRSHYPMYVNFIVSRPKIKTEEKDISKEQTDESKEQTDESKEQTVESKEQTVESKEQIVESKEQTDESKVPTYISKEPTYVVESSAKSPETVTSFLEFLFKKACCCGMGVKFRCLDGKEQYILLDSEAENKDHSTEKQEELQFFNEDDTYTGVIVERNLRAVDLCSLLAVKNRVTKDHYWSIVEHWIDSGLERILEDHEDVLSVYRQTEGGAKKFIFRRILNKYDVFTQPEVLFPADMLALRSYPDLSADVVDTLLYLSGECPSIFSQVCMQDENKTTWTKTFLLLKNNRLLMSSKVHVVAKFLRHWKSRNDYTYKHLDEQDANKVDFDDESCHKDLLPLADLKNYEIYSCLDADKYLRAPARNGICLRKTTDEDFSSSILLTCDSDRDRNCWLTVMRLAKYGKQLRENYKAFKNKQESVSAKELSAHNESLRSRVAMDFTGNEGRIVEDPKEARDIAISEGVTWKRRLRGNGLGQTRRSGSSAITGTTNSVLHHGQPWFYKSMPREHAATLIGTHGTQDGVFLVRESRSNPGSFVLTLKCATKVIHVPIHPINDPVRDIICYSLDNGVTKFYDLLQLVEFYQLNTGALPTRLSAYLERSRDTNTIKLAGGGGPPDIAGAAASSSSAGGGGGGAATSHSEPGLRCDSIF